MSKQNFFYHSFPRRKGDGANAQGLKILDSICRNGLLLVPEHVQWIDPTVPPGPDATIFAVQRRVCFTLLERGELSEHAQTFGEFSFEFTIESLRSIGALPVVYVPDRIDPNHPREAIGTSLLANLAAAATTIGYMAETFANQDSNLIVNITMKDGQKITDVFGPAKAKAIKRYVDILQITQNIPLKETHWALMSMSSIFYPTENLQHTTAMAYYQQKEWRIISGFHVNGRQATTVTTDDQVAELLRLDERFFSHEIQFADGPYNRAVKSHYMKLVDGTDIMTKVNRIIVPAACLSEAVAVVQKYGLTIPVEAR